MLHTMLHTIIAILCFLLAQFTPNNHEVIYRANNHETHVNNVVLYIPGESITIAQPGDICSIRQDFMLFSHGELTYVVYQSCNLAELDYYAAYDVITLEPVDF